MDQVVTVSDGTLLPDAAVAAFTPQGRALILWSESVTGTTQRSLRARWVEPNDSMGAQFTVRNGGVGSNSEILKVTATTDGDAVAAWRNNNSAPAEQAEARRIEANATIGPLLQPTDGPSAGRPVNVAPAPGAGALLAWGGPPAVYTMPVDATGAAGAVQTPVAAGAFSSPAITTDGAGVFHLLVPGSGNLFTLTVNATGAATGPQQVVDGAGGPMGFSLATTAANRSLALWTRGGLVRARFIEASGVPAAATITTPPPPGQTQGAYDVELLADGTGVQLLTQGTSGNLHMHGGVLNTAPTRLASGSGSDGRLALTPGGLGLAAWQQVDSSPPPPYRVAARQFLPPPSCPNAAATVVQGRPTRVFLPCTGLQLTSPQVLSNPGNGTLGTLDPAPASVVYTPRPGFQGTDTFTFRGTNKGGPGPTRAARVQVGKDSVRPIVRRFSINRKRVRLRTHFRRRAKRKPAFSFRFSEASTATITIERKRGRRYRRLRTIRVRKAVTRGAARLRKSKLRRGTYRATLVATDLAKNRIQAQADPVPRHAPLTVSRG